MKTCPVCGEDIAAVSAVRKAPSAYCCSSASVKILNPIAHTIMENTSSSKTIPAMLFTATRFFSSFMVFLPFRVILLLSAGARFTR